MDSEARGLNGPSQLYGAHGGLLMSLCRVYLGRIESQGTEKSRHHESSVSRRNLSPVRAKWPVNASRSIASDSFTCRV